MGVKKIVFLTFSKLFWYSLGNLWTLFLDLKCLFFGVFSARKVDRCPQKWDFMSKFGPWLVIFEHFGGFRHADFIECCWWDHFDVANISNSIVAHVDRSKWEPILFFGSLVLLKRFKGYINFFNQNTFIIFCHHSRVFLHQIIFCSYVTYQFEELNDLSVENKNFSPKEIGVELYFIEVRLRILPTDSSE